MYYYRHVLERCVCNRFYDHVHELINKARHGFLHGRSCVTQLLTTLHHVGQLLDNNVQTDITLLDFAKAFDSVDDIILLKKLKSYGISGNMYNWFTDYLHGRKQRVVKQVHSSLPYLIASYTFGTLCVELLSHQTYVA